MAAALVNASARRMVHAIRPPELCPPRMILHFTYHKCLTVYYMQVMRLLGVEFGFPFEVEFADRTRFDRLLSSRRGLWAVEIANLYDIDYHRLPEFVGSHFVRDPRDMVVSSYHYHKWTAEAWCVDPSFNWSEITGNPFFGEYVEADTKRWPDKISYQDYLTSLDRERGMRLEMIRNQPHIDHLARWNYDDPRFIEFRFEDVVGHELECFRRIFEHYGFPPRMIERGLARVDQFSMKRKRAGTRSHVRSGKGQQWREEFSRDHHRVFEEMFGPVVQTLGYE